MQNFYAKFVDPRCTGFRDIVRKTDRQTNESILLYGLEACFYIRQILDHRIFRQSVLYETF